MNQVTEWVGIDVEARKNYMDKLQEVFRENGYLDQIYILDPEYRGDVDLNYSAAQLQVRDHGLFIRIGRFVNEQDNVLPIIALAHELGHFVDLTRNYEGSLEKYIRELGCIESEVRAWEYAMGFLHQIGLTSQYMEVAVLHAQECLNTYYNGITTWRLNSHFKFKGTAPSFEEATRRVTICSQRR